MDGVIAQDHTAWLKPACEKGPYTKSRSSSPAPEQAHVVPCAPAADRSAAATNVTREVPPVWRRQPTKRTRRKQRTASWQIGEREKASCCMVGFHQSTCDQASIRTLMAIGDSLPREKLPRGWSVLYGKRSLLFERARNVQNRGGDLFNMRLDNMYMR